MDKCECYHEINYDPFYEGYTTAVCWGTKEQDLCNCGGNKMKCDFYPEVRHKADEELQAIWDKLLSEPPKLDTFTQCDECEIKSKLAIVEKEVKFYRWYIAHQDLTWDAVNEYNKWIKNMR